MISKKNERSRKPMNGDKIHVKTPFNQRGNGDTGP